MRQLRDTVIHGDCREALASLPAGSVDFVLTDPPYLVNYRDRSGRSIAGDDRDDWLEPAFAGIFRVLRNNAYCVSFYGWNRTDAFMAAWRKAGFRIVGHIVFRKRYASRTGFLEARHESAYLLAKGQPRMPARPIPDVLDAWEYTGNRLHPTQKPVSALRPVIASFTAPGELVLDPFAGSGSTLVAARELGRSYLGIELDSVHCATARQRLAEGTGVLSLHRPAGAARKPRFYPFAA